MLQLIKHNIIFPNLALMPMMVLIEISSRYWTIY